MECVDLCVYPCVCACAKGVYCLRANNEGHFDQCASKRVARVHLQRGLPSLIPLRAEDTASLHSASHPLLNAATGPSPETTQFPKGGQRKTCQKWKQKSLPSIALQSQSSASLPSKTGGL